MADVEALNKAAFAREIDVTKLSYHAYAYCAALRVLDAGSIGRAADRCSFPNADATRRLAAAISACHSGKIRRELPPRLDSLAARKQDGLVFHRLEPPLQDSLRRRLITTERFTYERTGKKASTRHSERETGAADSVGAPINRRCGRAKNSVNRVSRRSVEYASHRAATCRVPNTPGDERRLMYRHMTLRNEYPLISQNGRRAVEILSEGQRRMNPRVRTTWFLGDLSAPCICAAAAASVTRLVPPGC